MEVAWAGTINDAGDPPEDISLWSGMGELTFDGITYRGVTGLNGAFAAISPVTRNTGAPTDRVKASIIVPDDTIIELLKFDAGPVTVDIIYLFRQNKRADWSKAPLSIHGFLSNPTLENGIYSCDIETWTGDVDRGDVRIWSDATQKSDYPGDRGFEYLARLEAGVEVEWPP